MKFDTNSSAANPNMSNIDVRNINATGLLFAGIDTNNDNSLAGVLSFLTVTGGQLVASSVAASGSRGLFVEAQHGTHGVTDIIFKDLVVSSFTNGVLMYNINQRVTVDNVTASSCGTGFYAGAFSSLSSNIQNHFRFHNCRAIACTLGFQLDPVSGLTGAALNDVELTNCVADDNGAGVMAYCLKLSNGTLKPMSKIHIRDCDFSQFASTLGGAAVNFSAFQPSGLTDGLFSDCPGINYVGKVPTPMYSSGSSAWLGYGGTSSTLGGLSGIPIVVQWTDLIVNVTGGTVSGIVIEDQSGNTILSGVTSLSNVLVKRGCSITITGSPMPSITAFAP
jgi:hypothetical protein